MPVKIERTPLDGFGAEDCSMCDQPTPFWSPGKDVPLCARCAEKYSLIDVPTKKQWLERFGFELPEGWIPYALSASGKTTAGRSWKNKMKRYAERREAQEAALAE
jgi:hypothetical protein